MSKFLDSNGLTSLWSKFKSFLTTWKTENFGTGTYSNTGNMSLSNASLDLSYAQIGFVNGDHAYITRRRGFVMGDQDKNGDNAITMHNNTDARISYWLWVYTTYSGTESSTAHHGAIDAGSIVSIVPATRMASMYFFMWTDNT